MSEQENKEMAVVYKVKVDGEERRSIDLVYLKTVIDDMKLGYSILDLNPAAVGKDDTVHMYQSKAAIEMLSKIEFIVNDGLGLIKHPEPEQEVSVEKEPEPVSEEKTSDEVIDVKKEVEDSKKTEQEVASANDEGKIVL